MILENVSVKYERLVDPLGSLAQREIRAIGSINAPSDPGACTAHCIPHLTLEQ